VKGNSVKDDQRVAVSIKGRIHHVPAITVEGRTIVLRRSWVKTAVVHDELYLANGLVEDPATAVRALQGWDQRPDVFEFSQKVTDREPRFDYPYEWHNLAVLPIVDYATWLKTQAKRDVKENVRRAAREGVEVTCCAHDDAFVHGLKSIYDETPIRQGRRFWHFGKSFDEVRTESGHYADRSEFIVARYGTEVIGVLKMVYVNDIAKTMYVITKESHFRRRPANALIAKAVETCAAKGIPYFNYGVFDYPGKKDSPLTDFKKRHGFVRFDYPRYYVPLTLKGRAYLALGLHRAGKHLLPTWLRVPLMRLRLVLDPRAPGRLPRLGDHADPRVAPTSRAPEDS
jgi:hypothetical protein